MCGICGIVRFDCGPVDRSRVDQMCEGLKIRGPDASGISEGPGFVLGHRRLAIIDLSDAGIQPMASLDKSVEIVFNGEIYNFQDLRVELNRQGGNFRTNTDTEILIQGYIIWGLGKLLDRIRGMYAFAILDHRTKEIHLARDPVGKKPLFYHWSGKELIFASTAGALTLGMRETPNINLTAIADLLYNVCIASEHSIFEDVEKVQPGQALTFASTGQSVLNYWSPDFSNPDFSVSEEEWLECIEGLLLNAIRRRFIADVPVGITLSGGLDSSLITALAAKAIGQIKTFTVAIENPEHDESRYAKEIAEHLGTEHHELLVQGTIRSHLTHMVHGMGEPFADASAANLFVLAQLARQHVTVILTGDGGDELFGGYNVFRAYYLAGQFQRYFPSLIHSPLFKLADRLRQSRIKQVRSTGTVLQLATKPLIDTYCLPGQGMIQPTQLWNLFNPALIEQIGHYDVRKPFLSRLPQNGNMSYADKVMQTHMQTILANEFLPKVDYATMGNSLEARSPFLDRDLIELAMKIPADIRLGGGDTKPLLRKLASRYVPHKTAKMPKSGFWSDMWLWLASANWSDLVDDLVLGSHIERRGWFNRSVLQGIVDRYRQRPTYAHGTWLWSFVMLELWLRIHVEHTLSPGEQI